MDLTRGLLLTTCVALLTIPVAQAAPEDATLECAQVYPWSERCQDILDLVCYSVYCDAPTAPDSPIGIENRYCTMQWPSSALCYVPHFTVGDRELDPLDHPLL